MNEYVGKHFETETVYIKNHANPMEFYCWRCEECMVEWISRRWTIRAVCPSCGKLIKSEFKPKGITFVMGWFRGLLVYPYSLVIKCLR